MTAQTPCDTCLAPLCAVTGACAQPVRQPAAEAYSEQDKISRYLGACTQVDSLEAVESELKELGLQYMKQQIHEGGVMVTQVGCLGWSAVQAQEYQ